MTTPARKYASANREVGLTQISLWVPQLDTDQVVNFAEKLRLEHYRRSIARDDKSVVAALARRNRRTVPAIVPFEEAFEHVGIFMQGGHKHKFAMSMYEDFTGAIHTYAELIGQHRKAVLEGDLEGEVTLSAKMYVEALKATVLRGEIAVIVAKERNRPL